MMMKNKMIRALGLSVVAVGLTIGTVTAQDFTGNASVVVLSTINATEVTALDFGTVAAFGSNTPADIANLTIAADGTTAPAITYGGAATAVNKNAHFVSIIDGTPGQFAVTGAAPLATLTVAVSIAAAADAMTDPATATDHTFDFTPSGVYYTVNGPGNTFSSQTDATGALEFNIGGVLTTNDTGASITAANTPYDDATYTGTYVVGISY